MPRAENFSITGPMPGIHDSPGPLGDPDKRWGLKAVLQQALLDLENGQHVALVAVQVRRALEPPRLSLVEAHERLREGLREELATLPECARRREVLRDIARMDRLIEEERAHAEG